MFGKSGLAAVCAACFAGCAAPAPSRAPVEMSGVRVSADLVDLVELKVFVNDQKVIDERLSLPDGAGAFQARYAGQPVAADCSSSRGLARGATSCVISVGRESRTMSF